MRRRGFLGLFASAPAAVAAAKMVPPAVPAPTPVVVPVAAAPEVSVLGRAISGIGSIGVSGFATGFRELRSFAMTSTTVACSEAHLPSSLEEEEKP